MKQEEFDDKFYELPGDDAGDYDLCGDKAGVAPAGYSDTQIQYIFEELRGAPELRGLSDKAIAILAAGELNANATVYAARANFYAAKSVAYVTNQQLERIARRTHE